MIRVIFIMCHCRQFSKWLPHTKGANLICICRSQVQLCRWNLHFAHNFRRKYPAEYPLSLSTRQSNTRSIVLKSRVPVHLLCKCGRCSGLLSKQPTKTNRLTWCNAKCTVHSCYRLGLCEMQSRLSSFSRGSNFQSNWHLTVSASNKYEKIQTLQMRCTELDCRVRHTQLTLCKFCRRNKISVFSKINKNYIEYFNRMKF